MQPVVTQILSSHLSFHRKGSNKRSNMAREVAMHHNYRAFIIPKSIAQGNILNSHRILSMQSWCLYIYTFSNIHTKPTTQQVHSQLGLWCRCVLLLFKCLFSLNIGCNDLAKVLSLEFSETALNLQSLFGTLAISMIFAFALDQWLLTW